MAEDPPEKPLRASRRRLLQVLATCIATMLAGALVGLNLPPQLWRHDWPPGAMAIFGLIIPVAGWALGGAALMLVDNDWVEWSKDAILRATIWNTAGSLVIACAVAGYALVAPCRAVVLVWNAGSADALLQVEGATVPLASSRGSRWYLRAPKSPTALSTVRGPKDLPPAAISTGVYLLNLSTSESVHFAPVRYAADAVRGYAEAQRSAENLDRRALSRRGERSRLDRVRYWRFRGARGVRTAPVRGMLRVR